MEVVDFGHGFVPRVGTRNHAAVERCMARGMRNMLGPSLPLPWAIAEPAWAMSAPSLIKHREELSLSLSDRP